MILPFIITAFLSATVVPSADKSFFPDKASITKEDKNIKETLPAGFYSSGWETISTWTSSKKNGTSSYAFNHIAPAINSSIMNGGVVLVYIKGYDFEGFQKGQQKPLALPFYMMPVSENSFNVFSWTSNSKEGELNISVNMADDIENIFLGAKDKVQFRFFTIPKELLKIINTSEQDLRKTSYKQLVKLLQVEE